MVTFDGPNRLVILDAAQLSYTDTEIYSRWVDWVHSGGGSVYPAAFEQEGGTPIAGGSTPIYTVLQNQAGYDWQILLPETNNEYTIGGNLISSDTAQNIFERPTSGFNPFVTIKTSEIATVGAVLTPREKILLDRIYIAHYHRRDRAGQKIGLYDAAGTGKLFDFDAPDDGSLIDPTFNPVVPE